MSHCNLKWKINIVIQNEKSTIGSLNWKMSHCKPKIKMSIWNEKWSRVGIKFKRPEVLLKKWKNAKCRYKMKRWRRYGSKMKAIIWEVFSKKIFGTNCKISKILIFCIQLWICNFFAPIVQIRSLRGLVG